MSWLMLLVLAMAGDVVLADVNAPTLYGGRIVGGSEVDIRSYRYQLSLQYTGYHMCGASVVGWRWALTAGHCCFGNSEMDLSIRGGSANHGAGGVVFSVAKIVVHPAYDNDNLHNDVCMVQIAGSFLGQVNISTIPIATSLSIPSGAQGIVSGWGATTSDGEPVLKLRAASVKILTDRSCVAETSNFVTITQSMMCAGGVGRSICVGDSGSPLVFNQRQVGIVSFIINECGGSVPAIYTRVPNKSVREFIQGVLNSDPARKTRSESEAGEPEV